VTQSAAAGPAKLASINRVKANWRDIDVALALRNCVTRLQQLNLLRLSHREQYPSGKYQTFARGRDTYI
jgi:hypothetical protein